MRRRVKVGDHLGEQDQLIVPPQIIVLAPGGRLVFNACLAKPDYTPDDAALALGQHVTQQSSRQRSCRLRHPDCLCTLSDDSIYEYEKSHLPEGAWPPTSWDADWVSGRDVLDLPREECPFEMRWLVSQKPAW